MRLVSGAIFFWVKVGLADEPENVRVQGDAPAKPKATSSVAQDPREITDIGDWLEREPGVHVRRLGGDDGFSTLSIRGSNGNQVAVYLAGIPLTSGADPTLDLSTLPLFGSTRARIDRTFSKATLGPSTLGGTLDLDPTSRTDERAWIGVGSFGTARMRAQEEASTQRFDVRMAVSASRSDGDFSYYDDRRRSFRDRENAGHAKMSAYAQTALKDDTGTRLRTHTLVQIRKQELPGAGSVPTPFESFESTRVVQGLELLLSRTKTNEVTVRSWGRHESTRVVGGYDLFSPYRRETNARSLALGSSLGSHAQLGPLDIDSRMEGELQGFVAGLYRGAEPPPQTTRSRIGPSTDMKLRLHRTFQLALSARADYFSDASPNDTRGEIIPTLHGGAEWKDGPVSVLARGGYVTRAPSLVERFGNAGAFVGNPNLDTERALAADLGVRTHLSKGRFRFEGEATLFAISARDLITFVPLGAEGRIRATNLGDARMVGAELGTRGNYGPFSLRATYTLMDTRNYARCDVRTTGCSAPKLPGRPAHDLSLDAVVDVSPFMLRYGFDFLSGMQADEAGAVLVPARALSSVGGSVRLGRIRFAGEIRNLTDVRTASYQGAFGAVQKAIGDAYDYPLPGRSFLLTASLFEHEK